MARVVDRVVSEQKSLSSRLSKLSLVRKFPTVHRSDSLESTYSLLKQVNNSSSLVQTDLSSQSDSLEFSFEAEGCNNKRETVVSHPECRKVGLTSFFNVALCK